jgi:single-strand DNA-binding protein
MNKVELTGRICSDIELKATGNGTSVCGFRLAVQRRFKNAEGNYDADFISCVAWRGTADHISKYWHKGEPIELVGSLQTRTYEKDGQRVFVTEVVVEEVGFVMGNKKAEATSDASSVITSYQNVQPANTFDFASASSADGFVPIGGADDELPF